MACEPESTGNGGELPRRLGSAWAAATTDAGFPAREDHTSVVFDNKIWVIGGFSNDDDVDFFNDVWSSSDGVNWNEVTPVGATAKADAVKAEKLFPARRRHTSVAHGGKIWVIGGGYNDVWSSKDGETWTQVLPNNPEESTKQFSRRWDHTSVAHGGRIWVIGGNGDGDYRHDPLNDVWSSSDGVNWNNWECEVTPPPADAKARAVVRSSWHSSLFPSPADAKAVVRRELYPRREGHTGVAHDGKMWVIGGSGGDGYDFYNDVWKSEDLGETWAPVLENNPWQSAKQFSAREDHTSVVFDNKIWVIGGYDDRSDDLLLNDVWSSEDGETWTQVLPNNPLESTKRFSARRRHTSVVFKNKIWVIGGFSGGSRLNDVWFTQVQ